MKGPEIRKSEKFVFSIHFITHIYNLGFNDWPFMTVHSWGENPVGRWTLEIHNDAHAHWESEANFYKWSLELYGAAFDPNSEELKKSSLKVLRNVDQQV